MTDRSKRLIFIWDLDGTLLDSYGAIVGSIYETMKEFGFVTRKKTILKFVKKYAVTAYLKKQSEEKHLDFAGVVATYKRISAEKRFEIVLEPGAGEILEKLKEAGAEHFVFTHRGATTEDVLKNTGIYGYFTEIITATDGYPRKPAPDAVLYLAEKYGFDKKRTYYVGDRKLDIECACNAGIKSILYLPEGTYVEKTGIETFTVGKLSEIWEGVRYALQT